MPALLPSCPLSLLTGLSSAAEQGYAVWVPQELAPLVLAQPAVSKEGLDVQNITDW